MRSLSFIIHLSSFIIIAALLASCSDDGPESLAPDVEALDADSITRTSAVLQGSVVPHGAGEVTSLMFHYGVSQQQPSDASASVTAVCHPSSSTLHPSALIQNLTPGTTYYYCLEAGNGRSSVLSDIKSFTTSPVTKPTLSAPVILSQGPMSIICSFTVTDNGGSNITETGLYLYSADNTRSKMTCAALPTRIASLSPNTAYSLSAYAVNSAGETETQSIAFTTGNAIVLSEAGKLAEIIEPMTLDDWRILNYNVSISGPLNGDDVLTLRTLLQHDKSAATGWSVNLADATIAEGGNSYGYGRFTAGNTISYGMFADCYIRTIALPANATTIEQDAFRGCTMLSQLTIPASAQSVSPSTGCTSLHDIIVSAANSNYATSDGVLFDKDITTILWYPSGRTESTYTLPSSVTTIPSSTFQGCTSLSAIHIGSNIQLVSDYAFAGCPLTAIYIDATIPPVCRSKAFSSYDATLYVPAASVSTYKAHSIWGKFLVKTLTL